MKLCPTCRQRFTDDDTVNFCPADGAQLVTVDGEASAGGEPEQQPDPLLGVTIDGRYKILEELGRGGMGVVYRALQLTMNRLVAIKVLKKELTSDSKLVKRFLREVQVASLLRHPNTITIHDFARSSEGVLYFVMELLEGETLATLLEREGRIPPARALRLLSQMCLSLAEAHRAGVIHRDLKPENIFVTQVPGLGDFVKVLDFGIAKIAAPEVLTEQTEQTKTGLVFGTPHYMSPEQIRGETLDPRSDLYSLGVILYRMLSGALPFRALTAMGLLTKHLLEEPAPLSRSCPELQLLPALDELVLRLLEKVAERRFDDVEDLKAAVDAVAEEMGLGSSSGMWAAGVPSAAGNLSALPREPTAPPPTTGSAARQPERATLPSAPVAAPRSPSVPLPLLDPASRSRPASDAALAMTLPAEADLAAVAALSLPPPGGSLPTIGGFASAPLPSLPGEVKSRATEQLPSSSSLPVAEAALPPPLLAATASRQPRRSLVVLLAISSGVLLAALLAVLLDPGLFGPGSGELPGPPSPGPAQPGGSPPAPSVAASPPGTVLGSGLASASGQASPPGAPATTARGGPPIGEGEGQPAAPPGPPPSFSVVLHSVPEGARVLEGGMERGVTPYRTTSPAGDGPRTFRLRKAGYREEEVIVPGGAAFETRIELRPARAASPPPSPRQPAAPPSTPQLDDFKEMSF